MKNFHISKFFCNFAPNYVLIHMKHLFLSLVCITLCLSAFAQDSYLDKAYEAYSCGDLNQAWQYANQQCEDNCNVATQYLMTKILMDAHEYEACGKLAEYVLKQLDKKTNKEARCNCYVYMGVAAYEVGNFSKANKCFASAMKEDPTNYWPYYERALSYGAQGKYAPAIIDLKSAYERDTTDLSTVLMMAYYYEALKDIPQAKENYEKAFAMTERKNGRVFAEYSVFWMQQGDTVQAVQQLMDGMAVDPVNPRVGRAYNSMLRECPKQMIQEARVRAENDLLAARWNAILGDIYDETLHMPDSGFLYYQKAFQQDPFFNDGFDVERRLFTRLTGIEDYAMAEQLLQDKLQVASYDLKTRRRMIMILFQTNRYDEGIACVNALLPDDKDNKEGLLIQRSDMYFLTGRYQEAHDDLLEALRSLPGNTYLSYRIGRCYDAMGQHDAAVLNYQIVENGCTKYYDAKNKIVNIEVGSGNLPPMELPLALEKMGRHDEAVTVAKAAMMEALLASQQEDVNLDETKLYNMACMLAQIPGEEESAMVILEMAVKYGFRRAEHVALDPDFQLLRESSDPTVREKWDTLVADLRESNRKEREALHALLDAQKTK